MKKLTFNLLSLAVMTGCFYSCQENELPTIHPIIGEWESNEPEGFVQLYLEGNEKTPTEFGMEVFDLNESDARIYMENYLQNQVLGPISLSGGKIHFEENNTFKMDVTESSLEGIWYFFNSDSRLRLKTDNLPLDQYDFDVVKLTTNELQLKFEAYFELIQEGENIVHNFMVLINMKK
jgi:hypothetical protein